jgi:hypothetical protein
MNNQEFSAKINPLINRFNKAYNGDVLALIFDEVKNVTSTDLERLVMYLLGSHRVAPMVPDFRKAINDLGIKKQYIAQKASDVQIILGNGSGGVDWDYPIEKGVWANSKYFIIRDGGPHRFIIKAMCDNQDLLDKDKEAAKKWIPFFEKITDPKYKGELGTYTEHYQKAIKNYG